MKYRNASEILPDELLKELQKFASGEILYIPSDQNRKEWGAASGARQYYKQRNEEIRQQYFNQNIKVDVLAKSYGLSEETIRKILYR